MITQPSSQPAHRHALRACSAVLAAGIGAGAAGQSIDLPARPAPAPVQNVQVTPDGIPLNSPHTPRSGAYSVKHENGTFITARCLEGGTVLVSKASIERVPGSTPAARRDTALRQTCRDIDLTK